MKRKIAGLIVMVGAVIYARTETQFFGNNWWPQSGEEMVCDGIALLVSAIGVALFWGGSGRVRHTDQAQRTGTP